MSKCTHDQYIAYCFYCSDEDLTKFPEPNGINYVGFANYGSRIQQAIQAVNEVYLGEKK